MTQGNRGRSKKGRVVVLVLVAAAAALGLSYAGRQWFGGTPGVEVQGARVLRGPLRISVLQRGELSAKNSVSVKSEIEGQTTILQLAQEGTLVQPGDLLVRLDSSDLVEKELQQRIARDNSEASYKKAKAQYDIQVSQNQSDIETADRKLRFAELDLKKYREGDLEQLRKSDEDKILLAEQKRTQSENTLTWSKTLHEKGFLTQAELDRDHLDFQSSDVQLKQAKLALELFDKYEDPRTQSQLEADLLEARRGLERAKLQADARIADFQAALSTSEARLKLESDKLLKYQDQLAKTRITSPVAGMVVYSRSEGGRMGFGDAMQEGSQVREGQEILTIPSKGGMIAQASIHESVLKQVEKGLSCSITVDALPGQRFRGEVQFVAPLPDKGNWWANPNQRLYRTEVSIADANADMRPGMNCGIEILAEEIADTLYVPLQCVHLVKNETVAFVPHLGGSEERRVKVGRQSDKWVEVLDGLAEGEEVLLAPPPGLAPQRPAESEEGAPAGPPDAKAPEKGGEGPARDEAGGDNPGGDRRGGEGRGDGRRRGPGGRSRPEASQAGAGQAGAAPPAAPGTPAAAAAAPGAKTAPESGAKVAPGTPGPSATTGSSEQK